MKQILCDDRQYSLMWDFYTSLCSAFLPEPKGNMPVRGIPTFPHPRKKMILNPSGCQTTQNLIHRTVCSARTAGHGSFISSVSKLETPRFRIFPAAFSCSIQSTISSRLSPSTPMQQIQIQIIGSQPFQTFRTAFKYCFTACIVRINF